MVFLQKLFNKYGYQKTLWFLVVVPTLLSGIITFLVQLFVIGTIKAYGLVIGFGLPFIFSYGFGSALLSLVSQLDESRKMLHAVSITDDLTGARNRRYFIQQMEEEFTRSERYKSPFSLILMDMDGFKEINDTHGHLAGDAVLKDIASICISECRQIDVFARFGGDEFAFIMPSIEAYQAEMFLERLNKRIDDHGITYKGITIKKQLSFGVAEWDPSLESIEDMIASADSSLYLVKGKRLSIA